MRILHLVAYACDSKCPSRMTFSFSTDWGEYMRDCSRGMLERLWLKPKLLMKRLDDEIEILALELMNYYDPLDFIPLDRKLTARILHAENTLATKKPGKLERDCNDCKNDNVKSQLNYEKMSVENELSLLNGEIVL